jgi:hypothetical protein
MIKNDNNNDSNKKNLLIGCTGSIAVIRLYEIIKKFQKEFNISKVLNN